MSKTKMITARVDPKLKRETEKILRDLGLTTTQAITLFFNQINLRKALPFAVAIPNTETAQAIENGAEADRPGDQQMRRVLENAAYFEVDRNRQPAPFGGGDAFAVATGEQGEIAAGALPLFLAPAGEAIEQAEALQPASQREFDQGCLRRGQVVVGKGVLAGNRPVVAQSFRVGQLEHLAQCIEAVKFQPGDVPATARALFILHRPAVAQQPVGELQGGFQVLAAGVGEQGRPLAARLVRPDPAPQQVGLVARQGPRVPARFAHEAPPAGLRAGQRGAGEEFAFER